MYIFLLDDKNLNYLQLRDKNILPVMKPKNFSKLYTIISFLLLIDHLCVFFTICLNLSKIFFYKFILNCLLI